MGSPGAPDGRGTLMPSGLSRAVLGAAFLASFVGTAFLHFRNPWTYP